MSTHYKKFSWLIVLAMLVSIVFVAPVSAVAPVVGNEAADPISYFTQPGPMVNYPVGIGQSFTTPAFMSQEYNMKLTSFEIFTGIQSGTPSIYYSINSVMDGGTEIELVGPVALAVGPDGWQTFNFAGTTSLLPNTQYFLRIYPVDGNINFNFNDGNPYAGGNYFHYYYSDVAETTTTWNDSYPSDQTGRDLWFRVNLEHQFDYTNPWIEFDGHDYPSDGDLFAGYFLKNNTPFTLNFTAKDDLSGLIPDATPETPILSEARTTSLNINSVGMKSEVVTVTDQVGNSSDITVRWGVFKNFAGPIDYRKYPLIDAADSGDPSDDAYNLSYIKDGDTLRVRINFAEPLFEPINNAYIQLKRGATVIQEFVLMHDTGNHQLWNFDYEVPDPTPYSDGPIVVTIRRGPALGTYLGTTYTNTSNSLIIDNVKPTIKYPTGIFGWTRNDGATVNTWAVLVSGFSRTLNYIAQDEKSGVYKGLPPIAPDLSDPRSFTINTNPSLPTGIHTYVLDSLEDQSRNASSFNMEYLAVNLQDFMAMMGPANTQGEVYTAGRTLPIKLGVYREGVWWFLGGPENISFRLAAQKYTGTGDYLTDTSNWADQEIIPKASWSDFNFQLMDTVYQYNLGTKNFGTGFFKVDITMIWFGEEAEIGSIFFELKKNK